MARPSPERYILKDLEDAKKKYEPEDKYSAWQRNVIDEYKSLSNEEIKIKIAANTLPFAILMTHINIDYNLGSIVRLANALGAREVFYYGERKFDRRAACGTYHYTTITHLPETKDVVALKEKYHFVALEQTEHSTPLRHFTWNKEKPNLIVLGEESQGLQGTPEIFNLIDQFVAIEQVGSVRSLNASTACAIAIYDFTAKYTDRFE